MTAEDAIFLLCEEYNVEPLDSSGKVKMTIQYRIDWIKKNIAPERIESYVKNMLLRCDAQFLKKGALPSLFEFARISKPSPEQLEQKASQMFEQVISKAQSYGQYRDFLTDNKRLFYGLQSIGGWKALCNSDISARPFIRDRFIQAYIKCEPEQVELKPFLGIGETGQPVFLGTDINNVPRLGTTQNKQLDDVLNKLIESKTN